MKRLHFNVDCGEGDSAVDACALETVDAINVAVGGHAGDPQQARRLAANAQARGVAVHLHPSYPDRQHFGRRSLSLSWSALAEALNRQRAVLPQVTVCKFHGALYNDAAGNPDLAAHLAEWLHEQGMHTVLTPPHSALAQAAQEWGIRVMREGFADRAMTGSPPQLCLLSRSEEGAVFHHAEQVAQRLTDLQAGMVRTVNGACYPWKVDTVCIHGDGPRAVECMHRARLYKDASP
ncbi:MAG: LamB/YcsF family protein [Planctomycetota bacterium]|nr:MAG: LamB/YcsF family protein [Planctomycetota bacterium]